MKILVRLPSGEIAEVEPIHPTTVSIEDRIGEALMSLPNGMGTLAQLVSATDIGEQTLRKHLKTKRFVRLSEVRGSSPLIYGVLASGGANDGS